MEVIAKLRYFRKSPRKVRLVIDTIRGMKVEDAEHQLTFLNKGATDPILKLLRSAIANGENNFELKKENLFVKKITVDQGPTLKRWKPRAFGRASEIRKKSSHVTIVLGELVESKPKKKSTIKSGTTVKGKKDTAKNKTDQKVVDYKEVKKESKFNKDESDTENVTDQQNKPSSGFGKIKDKFSRRVGEK